AQLYSSQVLAGTAYSNLPPVASTGVWLGCQFFVGWKGISALGVGTFGPYYLLTYTRERSQTFVEPK
ncbi:MAG TPA: L-glutamate gamma-semialdehyde dehydrogenase, partial [Anaerolineales bacterium]